MVPVSVLVVSFMGFAGLSLRYEQRHTKVKAAVSFLLIGSLTFLGPVIGGVVDVAYLPILYIPCIAGWCTMCIAAFAPHPYDIVRMVSR
ncbi:MAG: hypothetical protein F4X82_01105 [Candidatus Spechtbacteria bacterium SB0662_bin_43]|uniref:Uncharacterized protein n=1 Tax=Candidatus Spechtbacteria bacterium SB0662_bin_43 TaxID=2604897 RepID=A0A845DLA8_9BACT|nr:hypothetical protein [Candidatus Spechtbacteria bacterium SB0662_bin_43]